MSTTRDAAVPILAFNSGSSSLKFALYRVTAESETCLVDGAAEGLGLPEGRFWVRTADGEKHMVDRPVAHEEEAVQDVFQALVTLSHPQPLAVGHRFVTGGPTLTQPQRVDAAVREALARAIPFALLHVPAALKTLDAVTHHFPELPQVVCFDTMFHATMPEIAARLPLPRALYDRGVRRYGFHGLSYESIVDRLGAAIPERVVIAHLGSGASVVAVRHGKSMDTTMGLTPSGGVLMATRPGDLDPGVLLFLIEQAGYDGSQLEHLVNHESGLLGISARTGDMATLLSEAERHPAAEQAVNMFSASVTKAIGAMAAVLGGLDLLVFTGGIGEHAPSVRAAICAPLAFLGVHLDAKANARQEAVISRRRSRLIVRVLPAEEDRLIARHTRIVLALSTR